MSDSSIRKLDGATSLGVPGVQGETGARSRIFFYGSKGKEENQYKKINFTVDGSSGSADITTECVPEPYDYILYTDTDSNYEYILIILSVNESGNNYNSTVNIIDKFDLLKSAEDNFSKNIDFNINTIWRNVSITARDALNSAQVLTTDQQGRNAVIFFPTRITKIITNEVCDISFVVPSNSSYTFDENIKIVIEFYSLQSFIMDTMLLDKYGTGDDFLTKNTHLGDINQYSIITGSESSYKQRNVNFDDERLENFTYIIKDFNDFVGTKAFTSTFPLAVSSLKRIGANPKAYIYAYIKNDEFVDKIFIGEFKLDFITTEANTYQQSSNPNSTRLSPTRGLTASPTVTEKWTCKCCGAVKNTGNTCSRCGQPKTACDNNQNTVEQEDISNITNQAEISIDFDSSIGYNPQNLNIR